LGVSMVLAISSVIAFYETPREKRKGRTPYIIISVVIFLLYAASVVLDGYTDFEVLFRAGSPETFHVTYAEAAANEVATANRAIVACVVFVGDALLLYRCYIIWGDTWWVSLLPGAIYIASVATGILRLVPSSQAVVTHQTITMESIALVLSAIMNITVTSLISFKLLQSRRRLGLVLPKSSLQVYAGAVAMILESALPLSIFGTIYAFLILTSNIIRPGNSFPVGQVVGQCVFGALFYGFSALAPQIIIFRVTAGRSWVRDPVAARNRDSDTNISRGLEFKKPDVSAIDRGSNSDV
ncbi:hypothetical protein FA15DRAFT_592615, partial [Coprinopsis marcescibilis]